MRDIISPHIKRDHGGITLGKIEAIEYIFSFKNVFVEHLSKLHWNIFESLFPGQKIPVMIYIRWEYGSVALKMIEAIEHLLSKKSFNDKTMFSSMREKR